MKRALAILAIILIAFTFLPVAEASSLSAGTEVPVTVTRQTVDNGDGSTTYRAYFMLSSKLWNELMENGYDRTAVAEAFSNLARNYTEVAPTRQYEIVFERTVPYVDEVSDGSSDYVTKDFFFQTFTQVVDLSGDPESGRPGEYDAISRSVANLFRVKFPLIAEGRTVGTESYFVYSTPRKSITSNADNVYDDGNAYHHVFRLRGRLTFEIKAVTPNTTGWLALIAIISTIFAGAGITIALVKK